jgi:membrane-bound lytic murein transglycosylase B
MAGTVAGDGPDMADQRPPPTGRTRSAPAALALVVLSALAGCQGDQPERRPASDQPAATSVSPAPRATPGEVPTARDRAPAPAARPNVSEPLPTSPTLRPVGALAAQLTAVEVALRDPRTGDRDVRRAGQFQQLAARLLATAPADARDAVLSGVQPRVRPAVRRLVEAAALLDAMTEPQRTLPDWRVVAPPPADELLGHYRFAARRIGVPWSYLAAIHLVETRMGRIRGVSSAGAQGPMQFLPGTWELYGAGGDIDDVRDAVLAAARLLRANGAPDDMARAVWHYNPSDRYVGAVTRYAEQLHTSARTYRGLWHWRVLYKHVRGTYVLDHGYPDRPARLIDR